MSLFGFRFSWPRICRKDRSTMRVQIRNLSVLVALCFLAIALHDCRAIAAHSAIQARGPSDLFVADPQLGFYWPKQQVCGIVAVYLASRFPVRQRPSHAVSGDAPDGGRYIHGAVQRGSPAPGTIYLLHRCLTVELEEIVRNNRNLRAVALVKGNHWVYVSGVREDGLIIYDYPEWRVLQEQASDMTYSGKAVLVGRDHDICQFMACVRYYKVAALLCIAVDGALAVAAVHYAWRVFRLKQIDRRRRDSPPGENAG